jgi:3-methylfumaryl-CoA hydratase
MSTRTDRIDARTAGAIASFFDLPVESVVEGERLPLMWHLFSLLAYPAQSEIGPDGHPTVGEPTPPGFRRMFAGGRVTLQPGLVVGQSVVAITEIAADTVREGKSGPLRFVTHRAELGEPGGLATLIDERDIVYLPLNGKGGVQAPIEAPRRSSAPIVPEAARSADACRSVDVDPTLLFRFSALTYNAHRIHYDREYAQNVEGYPGLVVHGPLQAVLMANLATELGGTAQSTVRFSYRLVAPLFEHVGLHVTATRGDGTIITQVMDDSGRVTATGELEVVAGAQQGAKLPIR